MKYLTIGERKPAGQKMRSWWGVEEIGEKTAEKHENTIFSGSIVLGGELIRPQRFFNGVVFRF